MVNSHLKLTSIENLKRKGFSNAQESFTDILNSWAPINALGTWINTSKNTKEYLTKLLELSVINKKRQMKNIILIFYARRSNEIVFILLIKLLI